MKQFTDKDIEATLSDIGSQYCDDIKLLLYEFANGRLSEEDAEDVEWHLQRCSSCLQLLENYRAMLSSSIPAMPEDLLPLVEQLAPVSSLSLDLGGVWRSSGAVSEEGLPQYKAGEELMLGLTMPWAGHLLIFLQGPDSLQIICPGTANSQTRYEQDASPVLSMNAAKDLGAYLLKVIAVPQEEVISIGLELDSNGQLPLGIENAAQILGRLDQTKLSISEVRFEIVPNEG